MCKYRRQPPFRRWLIGIGTGLFLALHSAATEPLRVAIANNHSPGTTLFLAVYQASAGDWQQAPYLTERLELPPGNPAALSVTLPPGRYAMRAFVDLNGNGALDRGRRRPEEPFAISLGDGRNKPSVRFSQALFTVDGARDSVELRLIYPAGTSDELE